MDLTEGDEQYDYGYLEGRWSQGKHRKYVGVLTREQFDRLVEDLDLVAEETETLGSLGVPWSASGVGLAPAISFRSDVLFEQGGIVDAYVTPLPNRFCARRPDVELTAEDWDRIKAIVVRKYGKNRN